MKLQLVMSSKKVFLLFGLLQAVTSLEDAHYWLREGQAHLKDKLLHRNVEGLARNVILFIGDGMGVNTITAARIMQGQRQGGRGEEYRLSFERFPHIGLSKTYNVDKQVPDSASTATALLTGIKTKHHTIGLAPEAPAEACQGDTPTNHRYHIRGIATWAQQAGKSTGFVTTTRVTHATPASLYAHTGDRYNECDTMVPPSQRLCEKDIARQLVEDLPGSAFNVILGGGQNQMGLTDEPHHKETCVRTDGKNLATKWLEGKKNAVYVNSTESLMSVDIKSVDHLLGLFSADHLPYVYERKPEHPSLVNMTLQAINLLEKNDHGYFLLVEAGRIDLAHHENMARTALGEACELDDAVAAAFSSTDPQDTLIIVTGDHSHAFTMNGYPTRGNDILGFANKEAEPAYETISYANGPGFLDHRVNDSTDMNDTWKSLTEMDRSKGDYRHLATMYLTLETHGGEDVAVFANGPWSHLLSGVYEQNYISHVMSYAACMGPSAGLCMKKPSHHAHIDTRPRYAGHSAAQRFRADRVWFICILTLYLIVSF